MTNFDKEYDHVIYVNMVSDNRFDKYHFYDADHMNHAGAGKLSR